MFLQNKTKCFEIVIGKGVQLLTARFHRVLHRCDAQHDIAKGWRRLRWQGDSIEWPTLDLDAVDSVRSSRTCIERICRVSRVSSRRRIASVRDYSYRDHAKWFTCRSNVSRVDLPEDFVKRCCSLVVCIGRPSSNRSKSSCCNAPTSEDDFFKCLCTRTTCFILSARYCRYLFLSSSLKQ